MINYAPGVYVVKVFRLNIRGAADATHNGTLIGQQLTQGENVTVFEILDGKVSGGKAVFGRISPVGSNQPMYICLTDFNRTFAEYDSPLITQPIPQSKTDRDFLRSLYAWAVTQGYQGPAPL